MEIRSDQLIRDVGVLVSKEAAAKLTAKAVPQLKCRCGRTCVAKGVAYGYQVWECETCRDVVLLGPSTAWPITRQSLAADVPIAGQQGTAEQPLKIAQDEEDSAPEAEAAPDETAKEKVVAPAVDAKRRKDLAGSVRGR